ncbi:MAG TPA: hypothetical protein VGK29_00865 [Paludibaculum sp.]
MGCHIEGILLFGVAVALAAPAADPLIGTWSLNLEKSEIQGGLRVTIERRGEAFRYVSGGVEFTALFGGQDFPIRGVSTHAQVSLKRVDAHTIERTYKRESVAVNRAVLRVSADGRFLTVENRRLDSAVEARQWTNRYQRITPKDPSDLFAGTWERNPVRSLGNSLATIAYEVFETDGLHFVGNNVEYRAKPDGKDYPVVGSIVADSVTFKRSALGTIEEVWKDGGRAALLVRRVVSADGSTLTAHSTGTTLQGDVFENTYVYERR